MKNGARSIKTAGRPAGTLGVLLFLAGAVTLAHPVSVFGSEEKPVAPRIRSEVEIGADRFARRFFRPTVELTYPAGSSFWHLDIRFDQKTNSRLQGEIDFRIKTGWSSPVGRGFFLEGDLIHFCRHVTSRPNPVIFDINELIARVRFASDHVTAGLGLGTYLGKTGGYRSLAHIHGALPRILGSEFSLSGEARLVNFQTLLHEAELSAALNDNVDLFVRNARTYKDRNMTYAGLRFKSDGLEDVLFEHQHLRLQAFPGDGIHKVKAVPAVGLILFNRPDRRFLLQIETRIPVLKGNSFLGRFRPDSMRYPLSLVYERRAAPGLYGFGYGRLDVEMPLDTSAEGAVDLGFGLGLRNQAHFNRLVRPLRFEVRGGWNVHRDFEAALHLGLNTVGKPVDFGVDVSGEYDATRRETRIRVFGETGGSVKIRPYAGIEQRWFRNDSGQSRVRFVIGVELIRWASSTFLCAP